MCDSWNVESHTFPAGGVSLENMLENIKPAMVVNLRGRNVGQ